MSVVSDDVDDDDDDASARRDASDPREEEGAGDERARDRADGARGVASAIDATVDIVRASRRAARRCQLAFSAGRSSDFVRRTRLDATGRGPKPRYRMFIGQLKRDAIKC